MQMIDNSLTVNIEADLLEVTGKRAPKQVNRLGSVSTLKPLKQKSLTKNN